MNFHQLFEFKDARVGTDGEGCVIIAGFGAWVRIMPEVALDDFYLNHTVGAFFFTADIKAQVVKAVQEVAKDLLKTSDIRVEQKTNLMGQTNREQYDIDRLIEDNYINSEHFSMQHTNEAYKKYLRVSRANKSEEPNEEEKSAALAFLSCICDDYLGKHTGDLIKMEITPDFQR